MEIKDILKKSGRIFIVPLDHPEGKDTLKLIKKGVQNFVDEVDSLNHDGYIFHSSYYIKTPIKTNKDFFLTVGEQLEDYKLDIEKLEKLKKVKYLTIFFEVDSSLDKNAVKFYKEYVTKLKEKNYIVMGMGYPSEKWEDPDYQIVADIAKEIGCNYFKTDFSKNLVSLNLHGMKLFIAGGEFLESPKFEQFVTDVENLKIASASFGRNIFESDSPKERINLIIEEFRMPTHPKKI